MTTTEWTSMYMGGVKVVSVTHSPDAYYTAYYTSVNSGYASGGVIHNPPLDLPYNPRVTCWHCHRDRHDGPLTRRVANMYLSHEFDPTYDPEQDTSEIVCVGSDHYGPARPAVAPTVSTGAVMTGTFISSPSWDSSPSWNQSWYPADFSLKAKTWLPTQAEPEPPAPNLPAKYEYQDLSKVSPWAHEPLPESSYALDVALAKANFKGKDIPTPKAPKVDYEALNATLNPQPYKGKKKK